MPVVDYTNLTPFFDNASHPLSAYYGGNLALAQSEIGSFIRALTEETGRCCVQAQANAIATTGRIDLPAGRCMWDYAVNLGEKGLRVVGKGGAQTTLVATTQTPFFLSYPAAHTLPTIVSNVGGSGQKGIQFAGVSAGGDGYLDLSSVNMADFTSLAALTVEAYVTLTQLPGEFDLADWISCQGCLDSDGSGQLWDISFQPQFFTQSGVLKMRMLTKQNGQQDYADITVPGVTAGTRHHYAITRAGAVLKLWVDGVLAGTFTQTFVSNQVRRPWENIRIGYSPFGWPHGTPLNKTINGIVDSVRISNVVRYTGTFTPPTGSPVVDANTILKCDFSDVNGLLVKVTNLPQNPNDGYAIWNYGDYAGDVTGAAIQELGFEDGTAGLYAYGWHDSELPNLYSLRTRNPLILKGHSFKNAIRSPRFTIGRVGIEMSQVSFNTVYDPQIAYMSAFGVVASDSALTLAGRPFFFGSGEGAVLSNGSSGDGLTIDNMFSSDEALLAPTTSHVWAFNCPRLSIRNCSFFASLSPNSVIRIKSAKTGVLENNTFYAKSDATYMVRIDNQPTKLIVDLVNNILPASASTTAVMTNHPEWTFDPSVLSGLVDSGTITGGDGRAGTPQVHFEDTAFNIDVDLTTPASVAGMTLIAEVHPRRGGTAILTKAVTILQLSPPRLRVSFTAGEVPVGHWKWEIARTDVGFETVPVWAPLVILAR